MVNPARSGFGGVLVAAFLSLLLCTFLHATPVLADCGVFDGPFGVSSPPPATLPSGIGVAVQTTGSVSDGAPGYRLGSTGLVPGQTGAITFIFSQPIRSFRDGFYGLDVNESVSYIVNGASYAPSVSEIKASTYNGTTGTWTFGAPGFIHVSGPSAGALVEIQPPGGITSITITNTVAMGDTGGTIHDLSIEDCLADIPVISAVQTITPGTTLVARQPTTFTFEINETHGFSASNLTIKDAALGDILDATTVMVNPMSCTFADLIGSGCNLGTLAANGTLNLVVTGDVLVSADGENSQAIISTDELVDQNSNNVGPLSVSPIALGASGCDGDSDNCAGLLVCATSSDTCLIAAGQSTCADETDCAITNSICRVGTCYSPNGQSCGKDQECATGICDPGTKACEACNSAHKNCVGDTPLCLVGGGAGTHACVRALMMVIAP